MRSSKGILFVISGPSGVGKSAILEEIFKTDQRLVFSVSATTRKARDTEIPGFHYHFVTEDEFKKMIEEDKFLEWAYVHGNYYGTPRDFVEEQLDKGKDMVLDIDVQGAIKVMASRPESTFIFIAPPDMDVNILKNRLNNRKTEDQHQIEERLRVAENEMKEAYKYEYIIFNSSLSEAINDLRSIIRAERCRTKRYDLSILAERSRK